MALTRDFKETVVARVRADPAYAKALLEEALTLLLKGESDSAKLILRDLVNATIGFEKLAGEMGKTGKSVHRMLSRGGNPTLENLSAIIVAVERWLGVEIRVVVSPTDDLATLAGCWSRKEKEQFDRVLKEQRKIEQDTTASAGVKEERKEVSMKIQVVFYSMYGHVYRMAEAVAEGAREIEGSQVELLQVPELVPPEILEKSGAAAARQAFAHIPVARIEQLGEADAVIFGTPTRFGNMAAQMRNFLDQAGGLWMRGALEGKVGSVFTSTATQHGGQESTILSTHITLLHFGMLLAGLPFSEKGLGDISAMSGGSPYGATTITGGDGKRLPSPAELALARAQGRRVATITRDLLRGRSIQGK